LTAPKEPDPGHARPEAHAPQTARARGGHASGGHGKRNRRRRRRAAIGSPPGTLIGDPDAPHPEISVIAYSPTEFTERAVKDPDELRSLLGRFPVVWVNVDGLGDVETIRRIGAAFHLHRLELEDVVNLHQRPKFEVYGDHAYVVAQMLKWTDCLETEQLSLFVGRDFVLTFQERPGDDFGTIRTRLRTAQGSLRTSGPDYLAYALLDVTIDEYFPPLEALGENLEMLEDEITLRARPDHLGKLHGIRRDLLSLRRAVWPLREAVNQLARDETGIVQRETRPYLNDLYDHTVQLMDLLETYRELASGLLEIYLSSMSHRLNEVMMFLTVIATIFIPLTFMSSIWGMNFKHMPELDWPAGYALALASMAAVAGGLLYFFKRRGWIGSSAPRLVPTREPISHERSPRHGDPPSPGDVPPGSGDRHHPPHPPAQSGRHAS
jgi:magnesium transporter